MTRSFSAFLNIAFSACCLTGSALDAQTLPVPPPAEQIPVALTMHGSTRIDKYYWLRDRNNPKVVDHLLRENAYADAVLKHTEPLQQKLYEEMVSRVRPDDASVPYELRGYSYYTRFVPGREYALHCRKNLAAGAREEVLLDVDALAAGHRLCKVAGLEISPDNATLALGVDTAGNRQYTIMFKDLASGKFLSDTLPGTSADIAWANDNRTVFYCVNDSTIRSCRVLRHVLGTPAGSDAPVFEEPDARFETDVVNSKDGRFIFLESYSRASNETRFIDAGNPEGAWTVVQPRTENLLYAVETAGDRLIIRTNDHAANFKLMSAPIRSPGRNQWRDLVPYDSSALLRNVEVFAGFLALEEWKDGLPRLRIVDLRTGAAHELEFGEAAYDASLAVNREINTSTLRYEYSSLTTPASTIEYDMEKRTKRVVKQEEVLGGYDAGSYVTERVFATAGDGTRIPVSLVYRRGMQRSGDNPLLLYAYGAYGNSRKPAFAPERVSLLDRGFIYAIAHVRGGQEMGRRWYDEGKLLNKMNTFTDFIACAEYLIAERYTSPGKLFASGLSAGGMLMGGVANMRPDLFKGILAEVPWMDVVTDNLDPTLPLTTVEYQEWGNANEKTFYDYMLSYSPYDNVKAQAYPAILATAAFNDTQVPYWSPAKWVAKLRELTTGSNVVLLKTNMSSGHSGASGRLEKFRLVALKYAFMMDLLGMTDR